MELLTSPLRCFLTTLSSLMCIMLFGVIYQTKIVYQTPQLPLSSSSPSWLVNSSGHSDTNKSHVEAFLPILLVTYYRGGSSFLGEAFNHNDDVFYWFEPLHAMFEHMGKSWEHNPTVYNPKDEKSHLSSDFVERESQLLSDILTCKLSKLPLHFFTDRFVLKIKKSLKLQSFASCFQKATAHGKSKTKAVKSCVSLAEKACLSSPIRVIKTIRFGMYMLPSILRHVPNLRVVHYARDPRGMLVSRFKANRPKKKRYALDAVKAEATRICYRMHEDFTVAKEMANGGTRITMARYEDLASDTTTTLSDLYANLSLPVPSKLQAWFYKNTHAKKDGDALATARKDSEATASRWQEILPAESSRVIDEVCGHVLSEYGYPM